MKTLSDYKDKEAFELWVDLMEPIMTIIGDDEIKRMSKEHKPIIYVACEILKSHGEEALKILERIDPDPVDGANLPGRFLVLIGEIAQDPVFRSFFELAGLGKMQSESFGSAMENTEDGAN